MITYLKRTQLSFDYLDLWTERGLVAPTFIGISPAQQDTSAKDPKQLEGPRAGELDEMSLVNSPGIKAMDHTTGLEISDRTLPVTQLGDSRVGAEDVTTPQDHELGRAKDVSGVSDNEAGTSKRRGSHAGGEQGVLEGKGWGGEHFLDAFNEEFGVPRRSDFCSMAAGRDESPQRSPLSSRMSKVKIRGIRGSGLGLPPDVLRHSPKVSEMDKRLRTIEDCLVRCFFSGEVQKGMSKVRMNFGFFLRKIGQNAR